MSRFQTAEHRRLADSEARLADWKRWGPYLSERAWGTVREDYSATGEAWDYFRLLQSISKHLSGPCALERTRPIPEGTSLWLDWPPGQPR
jgi:hypothetical protein